MARTTHSIRRFKKEEEEKEGGHTLSRSWQWKSISHEFLLISIREEGLKMEGKRNLLLAHKKVDLFLFLRKGAKGILFYCGASQYLKTT